MSGSTLQAAFAGAHDIRWDPHAAHVEPKHGIDWLVEAICDAIARLRGAPPTELEIDAVLNGLLQHGVPDENSAEKIIYTDPAKRYVIVLSNSELKARDINNPDLSNTLIKFAGPDRDLGTTALADKDQMKPSDLIAKVANKVSPNLSNWESDRVGELLATLTYPEVWGQLNVEERHFFGMQLSERRFLEFKPSDRRAVAAHIADEGGTPVSIYCDSQVMQEARACRCPIEVLRSMLSERAIDFFEAVLAPTSVGNVDGASPLVSGDTDGSTARMVILAMQAGYVVADCKGLKLLAELMEAEATHAEDATFNEFQGDVSLQDKLAELEKHLTFDRGGRRLVFCGDVCHDRFSCNKDVDRRIRERLHAQGVVFILGNHDVQTAANGLGKAGGNAARDTGTPEEWKKHEGIFQGAFYDPDNRRLFVHHGLGYFDAEIHRKMWSSEGLVVPEDSRLRSAFDFHEIESPEQLEKSINDAVKLGKFRYISAKYERFYEDWFSDFRPSPEENQRAARELNIQIVHGHEGNLDWSTEDVVCLNPREDNKLITAAILLGARQVRLVESQKLRTE